MTRILLTVLVGTLALGGCALTSKDTTEPPTALESIEQTRDIKRLWNVSLSGSGEVRVGLQPVVSDQLVYAAAYDGRIVAVAIDTGRIIWERRVPGPLSAGPGVAEGVVVVAGIDGSVIALNDGDGTVRWTVQVSSSVLGTPGISRGVVGVRTNDGNLFGLDATSGDVLWTFSQTVPSLTLRGTSGVVAAGDTMVAGFDNGRVVAVQTRDGQMIWEAPLGTPTGRNEVERMVDVTATPQMLGREIYAAAYQGQIAAMAIESGRPLWLRDMSSIAGLGVSGAGVWVTDADSEIVGLSRSSGLENWRQAALRARMVTAPTVGDGWIAVGDLEGWIHILDQESGRFAARVRADRRAIFTSPIARGSLLIVQGSGGGLSAYTVGE